MTAPDQVDIIVDDHNAVVEIVTAPASSIVDIATLGPPGPRGPTGAQGQQGDTGNTGAQGPKGDPADDPDMYAAGMPIFDRRSSISNAAMTAGLLRLTYFTAVRSETIRNLGATCGVAQVGGTLVRMGLYSVAGDPYAVDGDLTLVASTANDPALFTTANTRYVNALTASYNVVKGQRYVFGVLGVGWTTAPNLSGAATHLGLTTPLPRITAQLLAQTDLPPTITAASLAVSNAGVCGEILP